MAAALGPPSAMDDYLFDLRGYLVLPQALSSAHVRELNASIDDYVDLEPGEWRGWVQRAPPGRNTRELHNLFEAGEAWEELIDHPAWWAHMQRYAGSDALFLDECDPRCWTPLHAPAAGCWPG